jgi:solute carrier family 35 protein E3
MQVLGHAKTMLVLLGGWLFFGDRISAIQLIGIGVAVAGMLLYGVCTR